ncbi:regulatory factor X-associated protein [Tiliqua scincoides]|uniref:regulatory factor X-associated protein n=1 Tax=Tiliqua scincoides TaxID=71010 RepID=UPI003461895A
MTSKAGESPPTLRAQTSIISRKSERQRPNIGRDVGGLVCACAIEATHGSSLRLRRLPNVPQRSVRARELCLCFAVAVAAAALRGLAARPSGGTEAPGGAGGSSAAFSSASPSPPQPLTLLVMQPCGGGDGEAAGAVLQRAQAASEAPPAQGSLMLFYGLGAAGEAEAEGEAAGGGGESAGSPGLEDADDEDESGAQSGGGGCKSCTYQGCSETTTQVAKQRKPWMCKRHRNKMYKDKYKRKKSDQALGGGAGAGAGGGAGAAGAPAQGASGGGGRVEDCTESSVSASKQRTGSIGDRPAKPTLLEQVLNQKRLSLLRSPDVVHFLQKRQQLLSQQALEQRQQQFSGAPV